MSAVTSAIDRAAWAHAARLCGSAGNTAAVLESLMAPELTPGELQKFVREVMRHSPAGGPPTAAAVEFAGLSQEQRRAELKEMARRFRRRMRALDGSDDEDDGPVDGEVEVEDEDGQGDEDQGVATVDTHDVTSDNGPRSTE